MAKRLAAMAQKDLDDGKDPKGKRPYLNVLDDAGRWNGTVTPLPENLTIPLGWKKPRTIFTDSMSDLFYGDASDEAWCKSKGVPFTPVPFEFIDKVFAVMALCPQHTFQILTKRQERMAEYFSVAERGKNISIAAVDWYNEKYPNGFPPEILPEFSRHSIIKKWPLPNVWLGTSVEDQKAADERIPHLLKCPAAVRFLSCEPLLGPLDLRAWINQLDWIIAGGES